MKRIFSLIAVLMMAQMIFGAKVQVTNTSDDASEVGSLRWACETATAEDTIVFEFAKSGDKVIRIGSGLETEACVDGSTWADSIIIDGYNEEKDTYVFTALKTSGAFVKNIIVQNSDYGFSFQTASKVYDCIARNCKTYGFYCIESVSFIRCKALNNGRYGFENYAGASSFEGCDAIGNGFYGVGNASRVINSNILNNRIGLVVHDVTVSSIEGCVISGNDSIGVVVGYRGTVEKLTDNVIGLSKDQKSSLPNGLGILNSSIIDTLTNNVISGNRKDGISDNSNSGIKLIKGNFIGTNKYLDKGTDLGNKGDGYIPGGTYSSFKDFSNNYFGNNGGYGIRTNGATNHSVTLKDCYFGVTPDGEAMPNGKGGINWGALHLTLQNCHVGYNDGIGIEYVRYGELVILGGEISYNKDEGISYVSIFSNLQVRNATLDSNGKDAISIDYKTGSPSLVTETKFLHTAKDYKAVNRTISLPVPEFTSCKVSSKTIDIVGKIDTAISAKIELFYTSQGNQTAEVLVDSVYTDEDGKFSFSLSRDNEIIKDAPLPAFTATATYFSSTSELSDVVCPEPAVVDLTRTEFYVKVDGWGNGSSWETAMSPQTFAYTLPKVKDGTTFYVAEGTYFPLYDKDMNLVLANNSVFIVNSEVSIKGGYPADAKTGALSDPKKYETIFNGDIKGNNVESNDGAYIGKLTFENDYDNVRTLFAQYGDLSLYGLKVKGCFVATYYPWGSISMNNENLRLILSSVEFVGNTTCVNGSVGSEIVVDSCRFIKNVACGSNSGAIINRGSLSVRNSYFSQCNTCYTGGAIYTFKGGDVVIENSTFENCYADRGSVVYIYGCERFQSINSTYTHNYNRNIGTINLTDIDDFRFYNNTLISNTTGSPVVGENGVVLYNPGNWSMVGNIIDGVVIDGGMSDFDVHAKDNIIIEGTGVSSTGTNTLISYEDCSTILDGHYDKTAKLFDANVADNMGLTPTVKVVNDKLSDDVEIRFPRIDGVFTDQRGAVRREMTCMGAYEIPCEIDTTYAIDTISIGEEFHDSVYTVFGRHENVLVSLKTSEGCDSIISYTLFVRPNADSLNYYVKTERSGKGDGSSWDDAMSGEDFAACLPLVPDGVTFYVAAGTYKPLYGYNLNVAKTANSRQYTINSSVTIRGGYPAEASGSAEESLKVPSEPEIYQTIFDGDIIRNDLVEETVGDDGFVTIDIEGREDNAIYIFFSNINKDLSVEFDGLYIKNAKNAVYFVSPNQHVKISRSEFLYNGYSIYMPYEGDVVEVMNSAFKKNLESVIFMPQAMKLSVDSVLFENNQSSLIQAQENPGIHPGHELRLNKVYAYANGDGSEIIKSIGHDFSLTNSELKNNKGLLYILDNTLLKSTSFEENKGGIKKYGWSGFVMDDCDFVDNESQGYFILTEKGGDDLSYFSINNCRFKNTVSSGLLYVTTDSINIDSSEFLGSSDADIYFNGYHSADLSHSKYNQNKGLHFLFNGKNAKKGTSLNGNSIYNNEFTTLMQFNSGTENVLFVNNTIVSNTNKDITGNMSNVNEGNKGNLFSYSGCNSTMLNNTIVGNSFGGYLVNSFPGNLLFRGNIILGNNGEVIGTRSSEIDFKNNILSRILNYGDYEISPIDESVLKENILSIFDRKDLPTELEIVPDRNEEILTSLFDGTFDASTGIFSPIIKNEDALTPVVALKSDKLSDGTTIRFPRLENVLTDQRGVERLDMTCMGAYEISCSPVKVEVKDTVLVGDSYTFIDRNLDEVCSKVGSYYFSDTLKTDAGCDSVINLSLAVRPQKNDNGYYVKVDGTGDGSDWNNAMSPSDFAEYLPLVYDGETFHIAAGDYHSTYVDPDKGSLYNINTSVTLIGGYPDTVTTVGVAPAPEHYKTRLTADVKGNDNFSVETYSLDDVYTTGFAENDSFLIQINGNPSVTLFGLTLSGVHSCGNSAVQMDGGSLLVDRCVVTENLSSAISAKNADISVLNSVITKNEAVRGTAFDLEGGRLNVENSTLHLNVQGGARCVVENPSGAVAYLSNTDATFKNNTIANNMATTGTVLALSRSAVSMVNNTVIGNQVTVSADNNASFAAAFDDLSKVSLFGNIIVGNEDILVSKANVASEGYNIFPSDWTGGVEENDMKMGPVEYENVFDGKVSYEKESVFSANVEDNGGYTPTVAVFQSLFEGGKVIAIPSEAKRVDADQRGMSRKDTSCVGAFEFPTYVDYYVKQSPVGDGTGRDWANAMGDSTFARYFAIVPAGATFHVAAGTYHPLQDRVYNYSHKNSYRRFYASRPLNVFGGYSPQANEGAVSDPVKYATILSADMEENDVYSVSPSDYAVVADANFEDNSSYVMYFESKLSGTVNLKGLRFKGNHTQFRGCSAALTMYSTNGETLNAHLDSCSFFNTTLGIFSNADTLTVTACRFDSIKEYGLSHTAYYKPSFMKVEGTSFDNVTSALSAMMQEGDVKIQNSTFNNVITAITVNHTAGGDELNVGVRHNTISYYSKGSLGVYLPSNADVELVGNIFNTFVNLTASSESVSGKLESDYNIYVNEPKSANGQWLMGEHDMMLTSEDLVGVLAGEMKADRFISETRVEKPEHFTSVIPMLFDVLPNGEYVRMPIEEASVKVDQIATERLDLTSIGAYEMFSGRDTVVVDLVDTVCLGLNYQRGGWNLQSDTLSEGLYSYERFARGKIATDTIYNLELHVNPFDHIKLDQVVAQPTLCHGDGYGIVSLTPHCNIPGSTDVYVINSLGDTVSSDVNSFNIIYKNEEMLTGRYTLSISPITQCVVDTSVSFEIFDRDSLHAMPCADMILTSCANEPTSELKISLVGYHPAMKFYYDSVEVSSLTKGFELISEEDAAVTSLAEVQLSAIPVGYHTLYAVDACENQYPVKDFTVAVPASELVDMELVEYTVDSLPCGLDLGAAKVHVVAGAAANFSLKSSNGYAYDMLFAGKDTVLSFEDLPRGKYEVRLKKYGTDCTDSAYASFEIRSPEPLSVSLVSNGAACVDGMVKVSAQGGRGKYIYHWTNPVGEKADSVSPIMNEVSAGSYICVVEDSVHCLSLPDTLTILPNVENLSPLSVDSVATKNITCFKGNNGTIEVRFSTENAKQSVACTVTNKETGEVTGVSDTYEHSKGLLAIRTLPVGSFSYEVYYGTETCRLDTSSIKGEFSVSPKAVPFAMDPLKILSPQTCLSDPDGVTVNSATGWEEDYMVNLISSSGGIFPMTPVVEGGVSKLYAAKLSGGHTYYYQVLDACGSEMLTESVEFPLYEPLALTVDSYTDSVTCARANDAQISFTVSGGILDNHKAFVNDSVFDEKGSVVCDQIGKGDYYVSFKSVNASCPDSVGQYVRIAGPDTLAIKYTLTGNCATSKLIASASGECGSYSYLWSDGEQSVEGDENIPFALEAGRSYSLTITDDHGCDQFEKSFVIPTADQLPSISQKVYPESEKCYQGNNGSILVKPSLSAPLDFAITATVSYRMVGSDDSVSVECVLDPDNSYSTPRTLAPGEYQVVSYLGSIDCDMGVAPAVKTVKVDALPPLKIRSKFDVTDHTCFSPNGAVQFNVEGWTYTHTADIYKVGAESGLYLSDVKPKSTTPEYVGVFDVQSMPYGLYKVIVKDICGNSDESQAFEIQYKPSAIANVSAKGLTCINEPNGVLSFEVHGWTPLHGCSIVKNDNVADGRISPALPVSIDEESKIAYFSIDTMTAGNWRIWVSNECGEAFRPDTFVKVKGIDPYKIDLEHKPSKLELLCPYDKDGVIVLNVTGGFSESSFLGSSTKVVQYYGPTGEYVDSFVIKLDTSYVVTPKYDSLNPIVTYDTTFKVVSQEQTTVEKDGVVVDTVIIHYDTIVITNTSYPQLVDIDGNFINDTTIRIDTFSVEQRVEKYGMLDSLETTPITYDFFSADPEGSLSGRYKYVDLDAGTYRFTYKSALKGCSDKIDFDTRVTKPADVNLNRAVMPISCSSFSDGVISLAPRRGGASYQYFVAHDSADPYNLNRLYVEDKDKGVVEYQPNGVALSYRIDTLYDQSDIKSIVWSYNSYKNEGWKVLDNIVFPDSTDITEEIYYKGADIIKTPVYSNSHLEPFWHDKMGETFESNVVTISNLSAGYYAVLVQDAKACKYRDTFEVKLPDSPLKIDSVVFDANLAACDPTRRQILAYASGGWGEYNFTFSDKSKVESSLGEQSDGFRGGEATHYDKTTVSGWGVSQFLDPGDYTVVVLDEQGCVVESEKTYPVTSRFTLHIDSTRTKCPEDPTAAVEIKFVDGYTEGKNYQVVEYTSPCRTDTLDECRDQTLVEMHESIAPSHYVGEKGDYRYIPVDLSSLKMRSKTHGLFVYEVDGNHCGTYVQGTVVDTIPIFKSSSKSVQNVSCNGMADGVIELFVSGGTAPYTVERNTSWMSADKLQLYKGLPVNESSIVLDMYDPNTGNKVKDTTIIQRYITMRDMPAGTYYFTVIDDRECRSVMGDTATFDEKVVVKEPEKLEAEFAASFVCKEPSVTKGGNLFLKNVKGGVAPYVFSYGYNYGGETVFKDDCQSIEEIPVASPGFTVSVVVRDANQCETTSGVVFQEGELQVDTFDFWASTWYEFGDVVALIDVCGPEATFDSVSYVFYDEFHNVDPRIKMLDKRLYIYDLDANKEAADAVRRYGDRTKEMVPDAYFEKMFNLRPEISKGQARHMNFFKFEDSSIDLKDIKDNHVMSEALANHSVLMKAYFLGCEYQLEERTDFFHVINPNNNPPYTPIGQRYQIISFSASPNPFKEGEDIEIRAAFTESVKDAKIRVYHIDGKTSKTIEIRFSDLNLEDGEYVFRKSYHPSDLFGEAAMPDYAIIFLTTGQDQKSATLLHRGVNEDYWR